MRISCCDQALIGMKLCLLLLAVAGCNSLQHRPDPEYRWQRAENRRRKTLRAFETVRRQRSDYQAAALTAKDRDIQGLSYLRLAEIEQAIGRNEEALGYLKDALSSGASDQTQRKALLALGDLFLRAFGEPDSARKTYQQLLTEYPNSSDAELAKLRLESMQYEIEINP